MDEYLVQPLRDFVTFFEELEIPYALMGGVAVGAHGIPRPTHDLDFTITIDRDRLQQLYDKAEAHGYSVPESFASGWVDLVAGMPLVRVRQWIEGRAVDVDIFLAESRFQTSVMTRKVRTELDAATVWLVSAEDLVLFKLIAGRPRDIGDIMDIFLAQGELDLDYLQTWAVELGVEQRLRDVQSEFIGDNLGDQQ